MRDKTSKEPKLVSLQQITMLMFIECLPLLKNWNLAVFLFNTESGPQRLELKSSTALNHTGQTTLIQLLFKLDYKDP